MRRGGVPLSSLAAAAASRRDMSRLAGCGGLSSPRSGGLVSDMSVCVRWKSHAVMSCLCWSRPLATSLPPEAKGVPFSCRGAAIRRLGDGCRTGCTRCGDLRPWKPYGFALRGFSVAVVALAMILAVVVVARCRSEHSKFTVRYSLPLLVENVTPPASHLR